MSTIEITLNSAASHVPTGSTLRELVAGHLGRELTEAGQAVDGGRLAVAAAVDGTVVPRSAWQAHRLAAGQRIELVTAAQGG